MSPQDIAKFDQLRAEYSELLADYSYLKNSEDVLKDGNVRVVFTLGTLPEEEIGVLITAITKEIQDRKLGYTLEIADAGAILKATGIPND